MLQATGERWQVERGEGAGAPSLREQAEALKAEQEQALRETPLVKAAFEAFPQAELVEEEAAGGERNWARR